MANTGYKVYSTRKEYYIDPTTGLIDLSNPTGVEEANAQDSKYIAPELNYDDCPLGTSVLMSYIPIHTSSASACTDGSAQTVYHNGSNAWPSTADYIVTNGDGTGPFDGAGKYYKIPAHNRWVQVSNIGYVMSSGTC